jgi:hypothetical protein
MIVLDDMALRERLRPLVDDARLRQAIANVSADRLFLSLYLMGVSHGEGVDEAAVTAIGQDEIARLFQEPRAPAGEARLVAEVVFAEFFDHGQYRYEDHVLGRESYFRVREANRRRLRERGKYSGLNLYLTTTFGHALMSELVHAAMRDALGRSPLPRPVTDRIASLLVTLPRPNESHVVVIARHNALLAADRAALSPTAVEAIDLLDRLMAGDYEAAAELAAGEIVASWLPYADAAAVRARIGGATSRPN